MSFTFEHSESENSPQLNIPAMGLHLTVRLSQDVSGGALTVLETVNAAGFGPPLHRHREAEVFHILEGKYLYEVEGRRFHAVAGDIVSVPGGIAHTFVNVGEHPARQLVLMLPAMDAMAFFKGLAEVMAAGRAASRPDQSALGAFGARWGVEFLGPPIKATS
jgi:quercetin dioxygenase-like cupin family protein